MTVLVTGGRGFIGTHVVDRLLATGREVLIFDHYGTAQARPGVNVFLGDIRDSTAVTEAMAHADAFIHLAGVLGTAETIKNPRPATETNVLGGLNVLEAAAQYRLPGVNIAVGNFWMDNTYSISKSTVERFTRMFNAERGTRITTVRALNAYGPGQSAAAPFGASKVRKIMPAFICRALAGEPIEIYGSGEQVMDMIFVSDLAAILVAALDWTREHGAADTVVEAGTGRPTTVNEIADAVIAEVGPVGKRHLPMRPGEPPASVVLGNPATLAAVNYSAPLTSLEEGVRAAVGWFKDRSSCSRAAAAPE